MSDSGSFILILIIIGIFILILYVIAAIFGIALMIAAAYGFVRTIINYVIAFKDVISGKKSPDRVYMGKKKWDGATETESKSKEIWRLHQLSAYYSF